MPDLALFSSVADSPALDAGDSDVLKALVFRCGDYPDQDFSLTEAEADELIAAFAPVAALHGHPRSDGPLDGKLGVMTRLWRQGAELFGLFEVPKWLTALIPPAQRKLSLGFARVPTKRITEWSWVTDPIISDAQLVAAFAATRSPAADPAAFAGSRHSMVDQDHLNAAAHHLVQAGAQVPPASRVLTPDYSARYSKETQPMSWLDEARALFARPDAPADLPAPDAAPPAADPARHVAVIGATGPARVDAAAQFAAEQAALAQDRAALAAEKAAFAKDKYVTQATTEVSRLIHERRVLPAENQPGPDGQPALVAVFAQALADDATSAALFAQAGGTRFAALLAGYNARVPYAAVSDAEGAAVHVLAATGTEGKTPADLAARRAELLARTPLGQAGLKTTKGGQ